MFRKRTLLKLSIAILSIVILAAIFLEFSRTKKHKTEEADVEQLRALPYTQWSERKEISKIQGVKIHDPEHVAPGYNLYTNGVNRAYLMDNAGRIMHTWNLGKFKSCEYAELLPAEDLVAVCVGEGLLRVDRDSNVVWKRQIFVHHEVEPMPDGNFLTIRRDKVREYRSRKVLFDSIQSISNTGKFLERWSTFDQLEELKKWHLPSTLDTPPSKSLEQEYDYFHMNTIQRLPQNEKAKTDRRFREGNLLICLRNVNLVAILDQDTKKVVWGWGPEILDWPHTPTMLENGNILILDNGFHRKFSRVIEMDPVTKKIIWTFESDPKEKFHTKMQGSAQRLSNGNTLICESESGHVFEVTSDGKIVWEFWNPEMQDQRRKTIYRFLRIPL